MNSPRYEKHENGRLLAGPKVGVLHSGSADAYGPQIAALLDALSEAGYVDGDSVEISILWADEDPAKLTAHAATLAGTAGMRVIIAAGGTTSASAAKAATTTIPIVFTTVTDPILAGFVQSLDEPGGNMTGTAGLTSELDPKRLDLLKEFLPNLPANSVIGVLTNNTRQKFQDQMTELRNAAGVLRLVLEEKNATRPAQIDNAIAAFSAGISAILVTADPLFNSQRKKVVRAVKARATKVPAIYQWREFVVDGGLMSYGPNIVSAYRQAGSYAAKILEGSTPRNLPVMLPDSYELVINLRTASKMNLKVPIPMLTRAVLLQRK